MPSHKYASMTVCDAAVLVTSSVLDYEIYSPDLFNGRLYLGGWLTAADIGPDQLYVSTPGTDAPQQIVWTNGNPYLAYHLNDPSVVQEADGTLAMFVTALPNAYGYSEEMTSRNVTGLATSTNAGQTWTWQGVVIGQQNGIDATGAWSPSALIENGGVDVWYNTGWRDITTGMVQPIRILRSVMDPTGTHLQSTVTCVDAETGAALSGENVDVYKAADGMYWLVANDYSTADGSAGKIICYQSPDGVHWTPWSNAGATLLSPPGNTVLMTPTIAGIDGNAMTLMYAEQMGASATVERSVTIQLSDQAAVCRFTEANVFNGISTEPLAVQGEAYNGPVHYLQSQDIYTGSNNINMVALGPNAFLHGGSGDDALSAQSGRNVLDGGTGSNFLTGGTGQDVFFLVASGGIDTWTTVNGFKTGDEITVWDIVPPMWSGTWYANQGAVNALGATFHIAEGNGHYASLTLSGWSVGQAKSLAASFGSIDGRSYLHFTAT